MYAPRTPPSYPARADAHPSSTSTDRGRLVGDRRVHPVGLGCANLTFHQAADPARGRATLQAALEEGIELFDTAAAYATADGAHHNERLISHVLSSSSRVPLVATKGGHRRVGDRFPVDGRPQSLRDDVETSLAALGVDRIDLYFLHWPDPKVPISDSVGALSALQHEGKLGAIGVSNVTAEQLAAATEVSTIAAVQNPLSLYGGGDQQVVKLCEQHGVAYLAYSPLKALPHPGSPQAAALASVAAAHSATPAQIALAWLLHRSPQIIPLAGATTADHARSAARAAHIQLTDLQASQLPQPLRV